MNATEFIALEASPEAGSPSLSPAVREAVDIVTGRSNAEIEAGMRCSAYKDISARGRIRQWWYCMVWRNGCWSYLASERVPQGTFYAQDRHYQAFDPVFRGDLLIIHDRGCGVDMNTSARLIVDSDPDHDIAIVIKKTRLGELKFELPTGEILQTPNPRRK